MLLQRPAPGFVLASSWTPGHGLASWFLYVVFDSGPGLAHGPRPGALIPLGIVHALAPRSILAWLLDLAWQPGASWSSSCSC